MFGQPSYGMARMGPIPGPSPGALFPPPLSWPRPPDGTQGRKQYHKQYQYMPGPQMQGKPPGIDRLLIAGGALQYNSQRHPAQHPPGHLMPMPNAPNPMVANRYQRGPHQRNGRGHSTMPMGQQGKPQRPSAPDTSPPTAKPQLVVPVDAARAKNDGPQPEGSEHDREVVVENVPVDVSDDVLKKKQLFGQFGEILRITRANNGSVVILFDTPTGARRAVDKLNRKKVRFRKSKKGNADSQIFRISCNLRNLSQ